jgi:hypothetical protein
VGNSQQTHNKYFKYFTLGCISEKYLGYSLKIQNTFVTFFDMKCIETYAFLARSRANGPVLSVRKHDNSFQTQRIDLKLSTHLNKPKSGAKFEDGQNRTKNFYSKGLELLKCLP